MKGAIIGDIVGSSYRDKNTFSYNFPLFTKESQFGNITSYSISIADSLLQDKPFTQVPECVNVLTVLSSLGLSNLSPQMAFDKVSKVTTEYTLPSSIAYTIILRRLKKYRDKSLVSSALIESLGKRWVKKIPKVGERVEEAQDILSLSAYLFLLSNTFVDSLRLAVSYGGNSPMVASVVCSIAEAFYGVPENLWIMFKKYLPESMLQTIDQFYNSLY